MDIGLGFKEDENGNLLDSSGFNAALPGISFLGYGVDEDGDPKNIYSIVQRLTEISDSVPEGGKWTDDVYDEFDRLVGKLETACSSSMPRWRTWIWWIPSHPSSGRSTATTPR